MKKFLIAVLVLSSFYAFSQKNNQKDAYKNKALVEKLIINNWQKYSKSFEYADYDNIASFFIYPVTFSLFGEPRVIKNKDELVQVYKYIRTNLQNDYKYSLLDKTRIIWLSKELVLLDAKYSRFDSKYKPIYKGRGLYMYKLVDMKWKMFSVSNIPIKKQKNKKTVE